MCRKYNSLAERIKANTMLNPEKGCWEWLGKQSGGYGKLNLWDKDEGRIVTKWAHRISFQVFKSPDRKIPINMHIDHECFNTQCVNPQHLRLMTVKKNCARHQSKED